MPIGKTAEINAATVPVMIVVTYGVRNFGCTRLKAGGSNPSRDIE